MLKLAGEFEGGGREEITKVLYQPECQDTGNLEGGTHTIVPTSRPAIGNAQYSQSLTLPKPDDGRLVIKRIAARLNVNIAGLGTATTVYCAVRIDVDDVAHELFNESWDGTGSKLAVANLTSGTLYDLLSDGSAHTFYFLFWADVASQATVDVVQLWEGVGACSTNWTGYCLELTHTGLMSMSGYQMRKGTGSLSLDLFQGGAGVNSLLYRSTENELRIPLAILYGINKFRLNASVGTDLIYIHQMAFYLRREL